MVWPEPGRPAKQHTYCYIIQQSGMDLFSLKGKVIVVTGGTGILGEAFNKALAGAGAAVGILGRNAAVATIRAEAINREGGQAMPLVADVTDANQLKQACEQVLARFGRIDGLVNAAGGNIPEAVVQPDGDIFSLNMEAVQKAVNLNLFGTLLPVQVFGPAILQTAGAGSIVNISSVTAKKAVTKVLGYSLAKAAIEAYTKWFALEMANRYGDKMRMNALVPGFFLTEQNRSLLTQPDGSYTERGNTVIRQTPFKRFGRPDELTGSLIWLLSDASGFVTGTAIEVDGGFLSFSGV